MAVLSHISCNSGVRVLLLLLAAAVLSGYSGCDEHFFIGLTADQRAELEDSLGVNGDEEEEEEEDDANGFNNGDPFSPDPFASDPFFSDPFAADPFGFTPAPSGSGFARGAAAVSGFSSGGSRLGDLAEDDTCTRLGYGAPRGLACLHCTQSGAEHQANIIAALLFRSCLQNVAINYLVDGTFSFNQDLLADHIELLSSGERRPYIYFYLSNGASQRQWSSTPIDSFGVRIEPREFRRRIRSDARLQEQYRSIVRRLIPTIRYAISRGAIVSIIPALEDNLDNESFEALLQLTVAEIPRGLPVRLGRNPCPSCYGGNTADVPEGLFLEEHTVNPFPTSSRGLITNDGRNYIYPSTTGGGGGESRALKLSDLKLVRNAASMLNSTFILWSAERQGLIDYGQPTARILHPGERSYQIPSRGEQRAILTFLREDLTPSPRRRQAEDRQNQE